MEKTSHFCIRYCVRGSLCQLLEQFITVWCSIQRCGQGFVCDGEIYFVLPFLLFLLRCCCARNISDGRSSRKAVTSKPATDGRWPPDYDNTAAPTTYVVRLTYGYQYTKSTFPLSYQKRKMKNVLLGMVWVGSLFLRIIKMSTHATTKRGRGRNGCYGVVVGRLVGCVCGGGGVFQSSGTLF